MSPGVGIYGQAGWGGRQPVAWLGRAPVPSYDLTKTARPVVAVLDTGIGEHAWLSDTFVQREVHVLGTRIGIDPEAVAAELHGTADPLVAELDTDAGHGTFIAGLVRQACPEALLLDVPTYGNDGQVSEFELLRCLQLLALRQVIARNGHPGHQPVDVVCLSLGYYHEEPEDSATDALLRGPLRLLGEYGAAVVVSAGNDATSRPMYPAAFAACDEGLVRHPADGRRPAVDLCCVGALNPEGTIALFSNDGPWVRYLRPGASLVSTFPKNYDASLQPRNVVRNDRGEYRAAPDPDDFSSGFGVWSGTSFSAPVFAGELAARLAERYADGYQPSDNGEAVSTLQGLLATMPTGRAASPVPAEEPS